jgi:aerobic carbon-monoxide dehydrogenase medium subunit
MQASSASAEKKYVRVRSVAEAIAALRDSGGTGVLIAGGLVVSSLLNQALLAAETIIDISRIEGLRRINVEPDGRLWIGALTTHDDILKSQVIAGAAPLLAEIAKDVACGRLRNRGTIGGSLCMIGQQGDPATGLIALGAELHIQGPNGKRVVPLEDFYREAFEIDLQPSEIVEGVSVALSNEPLQWGFAKLGPRNAMDWTQLAVSVVLLPDRRRAAIRQIRIGMNGAAPAALRAHHAEDALRCREVQAIAWPDVTDALQGDIAPESDVVFSADYKRHLASVLLKRAVTKCLAMEPGKTGDR